MMTHADDTDASRHCSVCFCPITDDSVIRKSLEGRYYCDHCSSEIFKTSMLEHCSVIPRCSPGEAPGA